METPVVYTSFDGDHMLYIDAMRHFAIRTNAIPLNPEHALGYYISTTSHKNSKAEVMKDCMSLTMISDEFWVFTEDKNVRLSSLSEGVLIEMYLWITAKIGAIRFFSLHEILVATEEAYTPLAENPQISESFFLDSIGPELHKKISRFTLESIEKLRDIVFLDIRDEDLKYVDWIRRSAYAQSKVPITPQQTMPRVIYELLGKGGAYGHFKNEIRRRCTSTWAIYASAKHLQDLKVKYGNALEVLYIPIESFGIPKYSSPSTWSITGKR